MRTLWRLLEYVIQSSLYLWDKIVILLKPIEIFIIYTSQILKKLGNLFSVKNIVDNILFRKWYKYLDLARNFLRFWILIKLIFTKIVRYTIRTLELGLHSCRGSLRCLQHNACVEEEFQLYLCSILQPLIVGISEITYLRNTSFCGS